MVKSYSLLGDNKIITKTVDISTMQVVLDYLSTLLESDTEIILMNGNAPLAKLMPMSDLAQVKPERVPDLYPSLWVSDDFDDLLPGEYWLKDQV
jgi:hypothetical protein